MIMAELAGAINISGARIGAYIYGFSVRTGLLTGSCEDTAALAFIRVADQARSLPPCEETICFIPWIPRSVLGIPFRVLVTGSPRRRGEPNPPPDEQQHRCRHEGGAGLAGANEECEQNLHPGIVAPRPKVSLNTRFRKFPAPMPYLDLP
jgi:hypothetical protein